MDSAQKLLKGFEIGGHISCAFALRVGTVPKVSSCFAVFLLVHASMIREHGQDTVLINDDSLELFSDLKATERRWWNHTCSCKSGQPTVMCTSVQSRQTFSFPSVTSWSPLLVTYKMEWLCVAVNSRSITLMS